MSFGICSGLVARNSVRLMSPVQHGETVLNFSSRRRKKRQVYGGKKAVVNAPPLQTLVRKLYMKVHPDFFNDQPDAKEVNEKSFQVLQSLLHRIRDNNGPPPSAGKHGIRFLVKSSCGEQLLNVESEIVTNGSICPNIVKKGLVDIFEKAGVGDDFKWDISDWCNNLSAEDAHYSHDSNSSSSFDDLFGSGAFQFEDDGDNKQDQGGEKPNSWRYFDKNGTIFYKH